MDSLEPLPSEKIAFIAYNIGVYECIQKFANILPSGKINKDTDTNTITNLLLESGVIYDEQTISYIINSMLNISKNMTIKQVSPKEVNSVAKHLNRAGVAIDAS